MRVGVTEKRFVKMNIPVAGRNATTPGRRGTRRGPRTDARGRARETRTRAHRGRGGTQHAQQLIYRAYYILRIGIPKNVVQI